MSLGTDCSQSSEQDGRFEGKTANSGRVSSLQFLMKFWRLLGELSCFKRFSKSLNLITVLNQKLSQQNSVNMFATNRQQLYLMTLLTWGPDLSFGPSLLN